MAVQCPTFRRLETLYETACKNLSCSKECFMEILEDMDQESLSAEQKEMAQVYLDSLAQAASVIRNPL